MPDIPRIIYGESNPSQNGQYFRELGISIPMLCIQLPWEIVPIEALAPRSYSTRLDDDSSTRYVDLCKMVAGSVFGLDIVQLARSPRTLGTLAGDFRVGSTKAVAARVYNRQFAGGRLPDAGPHPDYLKRSRAGATVFGFHLSTAGKEGEVQADRATLRGDSEEDIAPLQTSLRHRGPLRPNDLHIFVRNSRVGSNPIDSPHNFLTAEGPEPREFVESQFGVADEWRAAA